MGKARAFSETQAALRFVRNHAPRIDARSDLPGPGARDKHSFKVMLGENE
jgi:hypothetical protein